MNRIILESDETFIMFNDKLKEFRKILLKARTLNFPDNGRVISNLGLTYGGNEEYGLVKFGDKIEIILNFKDVEDTKLSCKLLLEENIISSYDLREKKVSIFLKSKFEDYCMLTLNEFALFIALTLKYYTKIKIPKYIRFMIFDFIFPPIYN